MVTSASLPPSDSPSEQSALSDAQLRANRRNARKSTGPRTPEGKARSSKNATTHGIFAAGICIEGEDPNAYRQHRISILSRTDPRDALELQFAEQIVRAGWKLNRLQLAELEIYDERRQEVKQIIRKKPVEVGMVMGSLIWDSPDFERLQKYEQRLSNMMHRAMEQLRKLRKDPPPEFQSDFAATLIAAETTIIESVQNEPVSQDADVSEGTTEGSATDAQPVLSEAEGMNTDNEQTLPSERLIDRPKEAPPDDSGS